MSIISIQIDTEEQTVTATLDGKTVENVRSASVYLYNSYYNNKRQELSWNISTCEDTGNDDFTQCTNYCSASVMADKLNSVSVSSAEKAKADVAKYFDNKKKNSTR